jgi:hypothetical protein
LIIVIFLYIEAILTVCLLVHLHLDSGVALKYLFGLPDDMSGTDGFSEENINYIQELITLLRSDYAATLDMDTTLYRVYII